MEVSLKTVYWHLTRQCNLRCSYCYFSAGPKDDDELQPGDLRSVAEMVAELSPARVVFTGGEPLLHSQLFHLARVLKEKAAESALCVNTNGALVSSSNGSTIAECFDEVRISMDGVGAVNDACRGSDSFRKAMEAHEILSEHGVTPRVFVTVSQSSFDHLTHFLDYLVGRGITDIHISPVKPIGRAGRRPELSLDIPALHELIRSYWRNKTGTELQQEIQCGSGCGLGSFVTINPNGDVYPCHALSEGAYRLGNTRENRLGELLRSSGMFRNLLALGKPNEGAHSTLAGAGCWGETSAMKRRLSQSLAGSRPS